MQIANFDPIVETIIASAEKPDGSPALLQVTTEGALKVDGISGGGGGGTTSGPTTVASTLIITAPITPQQVFAASTRKYLLIQNNSDTDMRIAFGTNPTVTQGILLPANGGGFVAEDGFVPDQQVNIICSANGKAFYAIQG